MKKETNVIENIEFEDENGVCYLKLYEKNNILYLEVKEPNEHLEYTKNIYDLPKIKNKINRVKKIYKRASKKQIAGIMLSVIQK